MVNMKAAVDTESLKSMRESLAEAEVSEVVLEQAIAHLDSEKVSETKYENVTAQSEIVDSLRPMSELVEIEEKVDLTEVNKVDLLPKITGKEKYVILAKSKGYCLNMQLCVDMASLKSNGCKLYLSKADTGEVYISENAEITVSREKILMSVDHSVMNVISNFIVNFTEDDKKVAFERAKKYLEVADNGTDISSSRGIMEILKDVVKFSVNAAADEKSTGISEGKFKVDKDAGTIAVISDHFQKVLDAVDAGCTKTVFCKKVRILEAHYGEKIIISNRNGSGFGFNDTNNRRYYKFRIIAGMWEGIDEYL